MQKEIVVSGVRPTGYLHLGNYFGAIKNFIKMQDDYSCFFFIADWHSLTTHTDTSKLKENVKRITAEYLACGLDFEKCAIYCQSELTETTELYLYLMMLAYKGELEKTTSFKEKIKIHNENINAGLLCYPVLMAADILIHNANKVPVGKDQEQHLEMTRTFANRFNNRYGEIFKEPKAFNFEKALTKIPSLDGTGKMSKSENINATIYLNDNEEVIKKKISKMQTDAGPKETNSVMPSYIEIIFQLLKVVADEKVYNYFVNEYNNCTIRYGDLKNTLTESMIIFLKPLKEKTEYFINNEKIIIEGLENGAIKAKTSGQKILKEVRDKMSFNYFK